MAYDHRTTTITVDQDTDLSENTGKLFINTLKDIAQGEDAPYQLQKDWRIIEQWLGCEGRRLTNEDNDKIGRAWKAYFAIGVAPSFNLQETFTSFSEQYKYQEYDYKKDKPPTEVMDVFDRLLATEEEIEEKQSDDYKKEKEKFEKIFKEQGHKTGDQKRPNFLSKYKRIFIALTFVWFIWVVFRTSGNYHLFGIYLGSWDEDMFLVNFIFPPLAVLISFLLYKWIKKAEQ